MLRSEQKRFIEYNFSKVLSTIFLLLICLTAFPFAFRKVPEETLIQLQGHIDDLRVNPGITSYDDTFRFSLKEYKDRTFSVRGMRLADESLLTNYESAENEFTVWVEKSDFQNEDTDIRVFGLSTSENTYLELSSAAEYARKARLFSVLVAIVSLLAGMYGVQRLRKKFKTTQERTDSNALDSGEIDPLLITFIGYSRILVTGVALCMVITPAWVLPRRVWSIYSAVVGLAYVAFLLGYRRAIASEDSWVNSVLVRYQARLGKLSHRFIFKPKYFKAVQLLLKKGANVNIHDKKGRTPLLIAAAAGETEAVALLLRNGAEANLADRLGNTPLMEAAKKGYLGVVLKLLEGGAKVKVANQAGMTAIQFAQKNKRNKAVLEILSTALIKEKVAEEEAGKKSAVAAHEGPGAAQENQEPREPHDSHEPHDPGKKGNSR